ncbi:MAG: proteasome accessory factor PafA2 family protein, partial [Verrucomicrobiales bacterium]
MNNQKDAVTLTPPMVVGVEDELALCAFSKEGERLDDPSATVRLIDLTKKHLPNLPLGNRAVGVALANGSFLYQDVSHDGAHAEVCTAECLDPVSLVIAREAGFTMVKRLCERDPKFRWRIFRHCVDPSSSSSWATHCNVDTSCTIEEVVACFVPFIVSKVIFAGSGGFSPDGEFSLAPRLWQFSRISGTNTEAERPLICSRDRPMVDGLRRQEFICHESLRSHLASLLDYGTTMLVMILLNHGIRLGGQVELESPFAALRLFSSDPECRTRARGIKSGLNYSAIELQRHYLEAAAAQSGQPWMPEWADQIIAHWRETLDLLSLGSEAVSDRLDWCIKLQLFRSLNGGTVFPRKNPKLMEAHIRFGEMGQGFFDQMDQSGLLAGHRVPGIDQASIDQAVTEPPQTRARLRSERIMELSGNATGRYRAAWDLIQDVDEGRQLRFRDRLGRSPVEWEKKPTSDDRIRRREPQLEGWPGFQIEGLVRLYDQGNFRQGWEILQEAESRLRNSSQAIELPRNYLRYRCWFSAKLGLLEESREALQRVAAAYPLNQMALVCDHLLTLSSLGLFGEAAIDEWIVKGVRLIEEGKAVPGDLCPFFTHAALRSLRKEEHAQASGFLARAFDPSSLSAACAHTIARAHTIMAECFRLEGRLDAAEAELATAESLYRRNEFIAEYADFYLSTSAKVAVDCGRGDDARPLLRQAADLQARLKIPGEVRSLLLLA